MKKAKLLFVVVIGLVAMLLTVLVNLQKNQKALDLSLPSDTLFYMKGSNLKQQLNYLRHSEGYKELQKIDLLAAGEAILSIIGREQEFISVRKKQIKDISGKLNKFIKLGERILADKFELVILPLADAKLSREQSDDENLQELLNLVFLRFSPDLMNKEIATLMKEHGLTFKSFTAGCFYGWEILGEGGQPSLFVMDNKRGQYYVTFSPNNVIKYLDKKVEFTPLADNKNYQQLRDDSMSSGLFSYFNLVALTDELTKISKKMEAENKLDFLDKVSQQVEQVAFSMKLGSNTVSYRVVTKNGTQFKEKMDVLASKGMSLQEHCPKEALVYHALSHLPLKEMITDYFSSSPGFRDEYAIRSQSCKEHTGYDLDQILSSIGHECSVVIQDFGLLGFSPSIDFAFVSKITDTKVIRKVLEVSLKDIKSNPDIHAYEVSDVSGAEVHTLTIEKFPQQVLFVTRDDLFIAGTKSCVDKILMTTNEKSLAGALTFEDNSNLVKLSHVKFDKILTKVEELYGIRLMGLKMGLDERAPLADVVDTKLIHPIINFLKLTKVIKSHAKVTDYGTFDHTETQD